MRDCWTAFAPPPIGARCKRCKSFSHESRLTQNPTWFKQGRSLPRREFLRALTWHYWWWLSIAVRALHVQPPGTWSIHSLKPMSAGLTCEIKQLAALAYYL